MLSSTEIWKAWRPDKEECYKLADIREVDLDEGVVTFYEKGPASGKDDAEYASRSFREEEIHRLDPSHLQDLDNIVEMNNVHEAPLLHLLRRRFHQGKIYTFTGDILISINPYKRIRGLYDLPDSVDTGVHAAPHLFTVAARALEKLEAEPGEEQTIIINGESGAGKTEASKIIISFLSHMSDECDSDDPAGNVFSAIQKHIVETNVLLEQFGNAKTVRNDNSSRFGKYIRLKYSGDKLCGAHISYFLLETSRLVDRASKERNYHVFYAMCLGASEEERDQLGGLDRPEKYRYLAGPPSTEEEELRAKAAWEELKTSLQFVGLDQKVIFQVCQALKTVLELGNIVVEEHEHSSSQSQSAGEHDENEASNAQNVRVSHIDVHQNSLQTVSELLGLSVDTLRKSFCGRLVMTNSARASVQWVELSKAQSEESINSLAKAIYARLFDWLVFKINETMGAKQPVGNGAQPKSKGCIGILDIYGFEILEKNSLEQLCINFANERLQRQFNAKVFDAEQQRYLAEGVNWTVDDFGVDNQPCIDLIGKNRMGILSILDEQTLMLYHATGVAASLERDSGKLVEEQLLAKLHKAHGTHAKHPNYIKPRIAGTTFKVRHFAGVVEYDVTGFPKKNTDSLHSDLIMMMNNSSSDFFRSLFAKDVDQVSQEQEERDEMNRKRIFTTNAIDAGKLSELDRKLVRRRSSKALLKDSAKAAILGAEQPVQEGKRPSLTKDSSIRNIFDESSSGLEGSPDHSLSSTRQFAARNTVSSRFRQQLNLLMEVLNAANPHYIRCIKPNNEKLAEEFDPSLVLEQLRYIGVLETVRIRKTGFPVRLKFDDFSSQLDVLVRSLGPPAEGEAKADILKRVLAEHLEEGQWQVGNSSIFLKDRQVEQLHRAALALQEKRASKMQAFARTLKEKAKFRKAKASAVKIQAIIRRKKEQKKFTTTQRAARIVQQWARRTAQAKRERAAVQIQSIARVALAKIAARRESQRKEREEAQALGAMKMQSLTRGVLTRLKLCNFKTCKVAAKRLQVAFRARWRNRQLDAWLCELHTAALSGEFEALDDACTKAMEQQWPVQGVLWHRKACRSLLHSAAESGSLDVVEYVLHETTFGAQVQGPFGVDSVDLEGNTVLHLAVRPKVSSGVVLCSRLFDALTSSSSNFAPDSGEETSGSSKSKPEEADVNLDRGEKRGFLLKSRKGNKFQRRLVLLNKDNGTLSYFKSSRDKNPRCVIEISEEAGTTLKVSEKFPHCFEITATTLEDQRNPTGTLHFKCRDEKELQDWVSSLRRLNGIHFNAALPSLGRIRTTSWTAVQQAIIKFNKRNENLLHLAAGSDLDIALYLIGLVSFHGSVAVLSLLHSKDLRGLTPKQHAEQAGRLDVATAFDRLGAYLSSKSSKGNSSKRKSINVQKLLDQSCRNGGTYMSLFFDEVVLPGQSIDESSLVLCISVVSAGKQRITAKATSPSDQQQAKKEAFDGTNVEMLKIKNIRAHDLVEDQVILKPVHWTKTETGSTILRFGALWNMQSPLEQLASSTCIVLQLKRDKQVVATSVLPFHARTIGVGKLTPGLQQLNPATVAQTKASLITRTWQSMTSMARIQRAAADENLASPSSPGTTSDLKKAQISLFTKVHYSIRTEPGAQLK